MTGSVTTGTRPRGGQNWAGSVLPGLFPGVRLPDLGCLAEELVVGCFEVLDPWAVAVFLPAAGSAMLQPGGVSSDRNCCCLTRDGAEPIWTFLPESCHIVRGTGGVHEGQGWGPWPAGQPLPEAPARCGWQTMALTFADQPVLSLLVVHPAGTEAAALVRRQLDQLHDALEPLLRVWAVARGLESELDQARMENQALSRLNALQEKAVAMVSHEFKTPLTSITAYTDALLSQVSDLEFPHAPEFLDVIRTEAGRLLRMANRMLDFSRLGAGQELLELRPENLQPLVEQTVLALRPALAAKKLQLETRYATDLPRAMADPDLMRQVLVNLLSNAIKYTPAGGSIFLTLDECRASVRVRVADTGMGIPQQDLQRIFREFYRTKGQALLEEGTGLGLTIVRNILNLHGGHIGVKRRPEGGTEFSCQLPKEVRAPGILPLVFTRRADHEQAWSLISQLTYLGAELTGSQAVEIQLRDDRDGLETVAAMGPEPEKWDVPGWLTADLGRGTGFLGQIKIGCPVSGKPYRPAVASQLKIIAHLSALALSYLTADGPGGDGSSSSSQVTKVVEALRSILQIRRSGIPTSSAEALDLVDKLGSRLGVGAGNIRRLQYAALLHDAGMARVEIEIVMGESELSWDQRDEVERHVEQGVDLMGPLLLDPDIVTVIRHHHERVDGKGYPGGLRGGEIPLGSRLLAVIDAWFALTRNRTFRPGLPPVEALAEIKNHTGTQFDTQVVGAFESVLKGEGIIPGSSAGTRN
jgi:signal transduction histidine kinase